MDLWGVHSETSKLTPFAAGGRDMVPAQRTEPLWRVAPGRASSTTGLVEDSWKSSNLPTGKNGPLTGWDKFRKCILRLNNLPKRGSFGKEPHKNDRRSRGLVESVYHFKELITNDCPERFLGQHGTRVSPVKWNITQNICLFKVTSCLFYLNVEDVFGWVKRRPVIYVDPPKKQKRFNKLSFQRLGSGPMLLHFLMSWTWGFRILAVCNRPKNTTCETKPI